MKAYVVYGESGEYDDYSQWVENIYLVPDDFNSSEFSLRCWKEAKEKGIVRLTKAGYPYNKDINKGCRYVNECLDKEFKKIEQYEN